MPEYRVDVNHIYRNDVLGTFEEGLILGNSVLQFGDRFVADPGEVAGLVADEAVTLVGD